MASIAGDAPRRTGVGEIAGVDDLATIHVPDPDRAIVVLQHDVGHAVLVEIAGVGDMPTGAGVGDLDALAELVAVHLPNADTPIGVLQQEIGVAVAVEVARADDFPARAGVWRPRWPG